MPSIGNPTTALACLHAVYTPNTLTTPAPYLGSAHGPFARRVQRLEQRHGVASDQLCLPVLMADGQGSLLSLHSLDDLDWLQGFSGVGHKVVHILNGPATHSQPLSFASRQGKGVNDNCQGHG